MTDFSGPFQTPAGLDKFELENGVVFAPRFSSDGLITAVVCSAADGRLLMVAHMNAQALALTLETGIAHYWSRSRAKLWRKGETSGNEQTVIEMRTDCDQDVLELRVETAGDGANCHTGRRSCFYRIVTTNDGQAALQTDAGDTPRFDPADVYGKK